jgi:hypothetical protein
VFGRGGVGIAPTRVEPAHSRPVFCQGWFAGEAGSGRYMSETHAPFWIYGSGTLRLTFAASPQKRRVTVDGRESLRLRKRGWHLVAVDIPRLREVPGETRKVGLRLLRVSTSPSRGS